MRKAYLLAGMALVPVIAAKLAALTPTRSDNTRLDGWEETVNWRRKDMPESPLAESA